MQPVFIALLLSMSVALLSAAIIVQLRRASRREEVLDRLRGDPVLSTKEDSRRSILRDVRLSEISFINELLERVAYEIPGRHLTLSLEIGRTGLQSDDVRLL